MELARPYRVHAPVERLFAALADPARGDRTVLAALAGYAVLWTLYAALAKGSQDIHFDMGEMIAWSREVTLGTPKHPPLGAWIVGAWFAVFPQTDWAYYLLSMALAAAALWIAWKIARRYLSAEQAIVGLALLTLVPFFNVHALKYNANSLMPATWALTTWWFLRSYETRGPLHAALAGLAAALAMLAKYWALILLLALGIAALCGPRRGEYFRSAAPWITVAAGSAALAPHIAWLYQTGFATAFEYTLESHPATTLTAALSGLQYLAEGLAYIAAPCLVAAAAARPSAAAIADTLWPSDPRRRMVVIAFMLPFVLPMLAAIVARERVGSLWTFGSMTLLPVVLLSSPLVVIPRAAAMRILGLAAAVPVLAVVVAPGVAAIVHRQGTANFASHYRLVAAAVEEAWRGRYTGRPLALVGSYDKLLYGSLIYYSGRPSTIEIVRPKVTPWTDQARIDREGIALVCPAVEVACMAALNQQAARSRGAERIEVDIARTYLGTADKPMRYVIVTAPPKS